MRTPIIAGNWKMHKTVAEALQFAQEVAGQARNDSVEALICAPYLQLPALVEALKDTSIRVGAQNLHFEDEGAYTGEISGKMLAGLGVTDVIIGHSERRQYFGETDDLVNRKVHAALRHALRPILCVGETLEEREAGKTAEVVKRQTVEGLKGLTGDQVAATVIAYEPVWAIGTGKTATAQDANEVIQGIRGEIAAVYGGAVADQIRIQYGGSVKPGNIAELMAEKHVDGALVGGASLEPTSFLALLEGARSS
jgi:triosephosphate isomerase